MDLEARVRELNLGAVRSQVEGREGDRHFLVTADELALLEPDEVQRVGLREITKITSDISGVLRVFAGERVAISTASRNFRSAHLKDFFIGVKNAVGHARLSASSINLPAVGSSGVDLPPVALVAPTESFQRPASLDILEEPELVAAEVGVATPMARASASSSVAVAPTPPPLEGLSPPHFQAPPSTEVYSSTPRVVVQSSVPGEFPASSLHADLPEQRIATSSPTSSLHASPTSHLPSHLLSDLPTGGPPSAPAALTLEPIHSPASAPVQISTAPPLAPAAPVGLTSPSSMELGRLRLQVEGRASTVRLMGVLSGVFGLVGGVLLMTVSPLGAIGVLLLGLSAAAGLLLTAEALRVLVRAQGEGA